MRHAVLLLVAGCSIATSGPPADELAPDASEAPDAADPDPLHSVHLQLGVATDDSPADDYLLVHEDFAESYNRYLNAPNWVSYRTTRADFGPVERYAGDFYSDALLPAELVHLEHADMNGSGFDRGHMLRSEERTETVARNTRRS